MFFNLKLLDRIRRNPEGVVGGRSVWRLWVFLGGYSLCSGEPSDMIWFPIQEYLQTKYRHPYIRGYAELLALLTDSDATAFDLFYNELDGYLAANGAAGDPASWPDQWSWPAGLVNPTYSASEMLDALERRPAAYLGVPSITRLHAFLAGESAGLRDAGVDKGDANGLEGFEAWLNQREDLGTHCRWDRIILFLCSGHEERAFDKFFDLRQIFERERLDWVSRGKRRID